MTDTDARDWAKDFENKGEFELTAMMPPAGLDKAGRTEWRQARQRAIAALYEADGESYTPPDDAERVEAEELALAREEQAQRAAVFGRASPFSDPAPVLDSVAPAFARPQARAIRNDGDTEDLLNGLIAECHLLMRSVTLPSAMRAGDADTRRQFLDSAMSIAKVGAKIGHAVAKLRGAGAATEIRQRHISEHVYSGPAPLLENGAKT